MIKRAVTKKNNKIIIKNILSQLPFKVKIGNFMNGYFIFEKAPSSVCHFTIKGFDNWKFGIWIESDNSFQIFGDHTLIIDKFKPSASTVSEQSINAFIESLNATYNNAEYVSDVCYCEHIANEKQKLNCANYASVQKLCTEMSNKNVIFSIQDKNTKGWVVSPRYEIVCMLEDNVTAIEEEQIVSEFKEKLDKAVISHDDYFLHMFMF